MVSNKKDSFCPYKHIHLLSEASGLWNASREQRKRVYLVYDGLGIKKEQFNGSIVLKVRYTLNVEPETQKKVP